jgi:PAS domain S-box-containing protein
MSLISLLKNPFTWIKNILLRQTFDHMLEGIQIHDFSWRYTYVNNAFLNYSHYSRQELLGNTMMDRYPGIEKTELFKVLERCMNKRLSEHFETEFIFPDGSKADFELSIQPVPEGLFILSLNISDRKRALEKQRTSETYYHTAIEQANDTIYIVDSSPKPKFIDINQSGCDLLGYTREEILQLTIFDIVFENDFADSTSKVQDLRAHKAIRKDRKLKRKDGSAVDTELSAKQMEDGNIMVVVRDISERKKTEKEILTLNENLEQKVRDRTLELENVITELKESEAQLEAVNKELEAFTYSVSHDLRAPLRAINGYAQMLHEDYGYQFDADGNRIIQTITENAVKMGNLIGDLLAFSKLGRKEIKKEQVNLNELVERVLFDLNKNSSHNATIKIGSLNTVKADDTLLYQVIFNLISNGLKYSSKNENPQVEINSESQNGEIVFSVKDNGAGFDMKYADKLFGVFQRLHSQEEFEGTGVGLAIVQRIIAKHNGKVWAEGKINEGAAFHFSLPIM